jgi:hypothetical protein
MEFFYKSIQAKTKKEQATIICQLQQQWIASLPNYIKGSLVNLSCKS